MLHPPDVKRGLIIFIVTFLICFLNLLDAPAYVHYTLKILPQKDIKVVPQQNRLSKKSFIPSQIIQILTTSKINS